jgi:hypothetical protein
MLEGILEATERMCHRITGPRLTVTAITITVVGAIIILIPAQKVIKLMVTAITDGEEVGLSPTFFIWRNWRICCCQSRSLVP